MNKNFFSGKVRQRNHLGIDVYIGSHWQRHVCKWWRNRSWSVWTQTRASSLASDWLSVLQT